MNEAMRSVVERCLASRGFGAAEGHSCVAERTSEHPWQENRSRSLADHYAVMYADIAALAFL